MSHPALPPLLLIGCGKMGGAMLAGWLELGLPPETVVVEPNAAAVAAFAGDQAPIAAMREVYQLRRERMLELLAPIESLHCTAPDGAFYVFANVSRLIGSRTPQGLLIDSDSQLVNYLLEAHGLATVAGAAYGMSPYIRLSFASSLEVIEEGCRRLEKACQDLR